MESYDQLVKALRHCITRGNGCVTCEGCSMAGFGESCIECVNKLHTDSAAAIEALQAEVERLQGKLCDWCAVCPKERRNPDDCELLGENTVMYGPSGTKMREVQE